MEHLNEKARLRIDSVLFGKTASRCDVRLIPALEAKSWRGTRSARFRKPFSSWLDSGFKFTLILCVTSLKCSRCKHSATSQFRNRIRSIHILLKLNFFLLFITNTSINNGTCFLFYYPAGKFTLKSFLTVILLMKSFEALPGD